MTTVQRAYVCDEAEARDLTEKIKASGERTCRLKPHLAEVTAAVADAVADLPEDERAAAAAAAVKTARERVRPKSSPPPEPAVAAPTPPPSTGGGEPNVPDLTGVELSREDYQAKVTALGETVPPEPTAKKKTRRPLPDQARDAGWELRKSVPKRRNTIDPRQKAQDALGVAQRRLAATELKIDALKSQAAALLPDVAARTAEVAYLAQHPLLIADSGSPS